MATNLEDNKDLGNLFPVLTDFLQKRQDILNVNLTYNKIRRKRR